MYSDLERLGVALGQANSNPLGGDLLPGLEYCPVNMPQYWNRDVLSAIAG